MTQDLLPFYNAELRYLREMAKDFAAAYPKIAGRLRLAGDAIEDPFVGQMVEGVAFLNARLRKKLDDDFPELVESMLAVLHPLYVAPVPSMAIVALQPDLEVPQCSTVAPGTMLETEAVQGEACSFRTCYPVELMPVELAAATLQRRPFITPANPQAAGATSVLKLVLKVVPEDISFASLGIDRLRFYLGGEATRAAKLHELLTNAVASVMVATGPLDDAPLILPAGAIGMVGFEATEILTPTAAGTDPAYALLTEVFSFPQKFMFVDIAGLAPRACADTMEIYLFCTHSDDELERSINADDFALYATPVINLFPVHAEPVRWDPTRIEQRIIADTRRDGVMEIFSVDHVEVSKADGTARQHFQLFAPKVHSADATDHYFHTTRRPSPMRAGGQDCYVSLLDTSGAMDFDAGEVCTMHVTCTNRDLPGRLPVGGGHPYFAPQEGIGGITGISCLLPPTATRYPQLGRGGLWRLLSHLNLNHLSISEAALTEPVISDILLLHDLVDTIVTRSVRDRVARVVARPATARAPAGGPIVMVAGVEIQLTLKDRPMSGSGGYLLACVLERFFANQCAINAFTRTRLRAAGEPGDWRTWPARSGTITLL